MANYVIEGTVSEITLTGTEVAIKIVGVEGYAIKDDGKTYNVFRPKDLPKAKETVQSYIADSENEFTVNKDFENILTQASMHGKKIRLTIELANEEELKKHIQDKSALPIKSVTLLQK